MCSICICVCKYGCAHAMSYTWRSKGQPLLSILTFHLVRDSLLMRTQGSWPENFRGLSCLLSQLTSRMLTWSTLSRFRWVRGTWTWYSCLNDNCFTYSAGGWAPLTLLTWKSSTKIYSFSNYLAVLKYYWNEEVRINAWLLCFIANYRSVLMSS